jgi:hypothetical protein
VYEVHPRKEVTTNTLFSPRVAHMERTHDQAFARPVRPERHVLELLLADEQADDCIQHVFRQLYDIDNRWFRSLAMVSRRLSTLANRLLVAGQYNIYFWSCASPDVKWRQNSFLEYWPPGIHQSPSLTELRQYILQSLPRSVAPDTIKITPPFVLDPADEGARSWWNASNGDLVPLPSLEAARAHKRERKRAKFEARLREAAASGLLRSLLQ